MNYDIKIIGEQEDNGLIEFDRLNFLTKSTKDIATKALMLHLRGFSEIIPDKHLKKALELKLKSIAGNSQDGTSLTIDCAYFEETIKGLQLNFFKPGKELLQVTPMSLVIESFRTALHNENDDIDLDKPLLKSLLNFKNNFISNNEIFLLSNRGTIPEVQLTKDDFSKIARLEDSIPEPNKVIVNGKLDEMKVSKGKLGLETEQGLVNVFARDTTYIGRLVEFMGKEITISGLAHYKPNGQLSFIEVHEFDKPIEKDIFFSKLPNAMTAHQQLLFQLKRKKRFSSLDALKSMSGMLKEEIDDEQFNEMIKDAHR